MDEGGGGMQGGVHHVADITIRSGFPRGRLEVCLARGRNRGRRCRGEFFFDSPLFRLVAAPERGWVSRGGVREYAFATANSGILQSARARLLASCARPLSPFHCPLPSQVSNYSRTILNFIPWPRADSKNARYIPREATTGCHLSGTRSPAGAVGLREIDAILDRNVQTAYIVSV